MLADGGPKKPGSMYGAVKPESMYGAVKPGSMYGAVKPGSMHEAVKPGSMYGAVKVDGTGAADFEDACMRVLGMYGCNLRTHRTNAPHP